MTSNRDPREQAETAAPNGATTDDIRNQSEAPAAEPDTLAQLEAEKIELKDRLMRSLAEMENLRRRSERDAADARTYAVTNFARDMLTVADNIGRALDSAKKAGESEAIKPLIEGVELTERDLISILARHGVKQLSPEGQKFDPHFHQAMFEVPNDKVPNGTVVQVMQTGYSIGDRVLRPALVGVAKGGPKAAAPAPETPSEQTN